MKKTQILRILFFLIVTLSAKQLLKKHNTENYIRKKLNPQLIFLNNYKINQNDTGEFPTVLKSKSASQQIADEELGEPVAITEGSDFSEVQVEPMNAILGNTTAIGYKLLYTNKLLNRSNALGLVENKLDVISAGLGIKMNTKVLSDAIHSAGQSLPSNLSNWRDADAIDPRKDSIRLRDVFNSDEHPFDLDFAYISDEIFVNLAEYYMSFDLPFEGNEINVDGTKFRNAKTSFKNTDENFLGTSSTAASGTVEAYVDPEFSSFKSAKQTDPSRNIPQSLVNLAEYKDPERPGIKGWFIWSELGFASLEPDAAMKGLL
jgi:hypothetical protein